MPQVTLKHCCIADVSMDETPKGGGKNKVVKINIDEEDFFDMLDSINPKNIIKYLDMRGIPHRDALQVNVCPISLDSLSSRHSDEYGAAISRIIRLESKNAKKLERIEKLVAMYNINKAKV